MTTAFPAAPFVHLLLQQVPELRFVYDTHVHDNDELLPHVFMGDVTRYVVQQTLAGKMGPGTPVERILGVLDQGLANGDASVQELICVSFIENIEEHGEAMAKLRFLFGPAVQRELHDRGSHGTRTLLWYDALFIEFQSLNQERTFLGSEGANEQAVRAAEQTMAITFPPSFRAFLLNHNGGYVNGDELLQLVPPPFNGQHPDIVWYHARRRARSTPDDKLLIVPCDEQSYFLDLAHTDSRGEHPVVVREHGQPFEIVAPDFPTFLLRLARSHC